MTSKEIVKRIIHHNNPPRVGFAFTGNNPSDILIAPGVKLIRPDKLAYAEWGYYPEILAQVPNFLLGTATRPPNRTILQGLFGRRTA